LHLFPNRIINSFRTNPQQQQGDCDVPSLQRTPKRPKTDHDETTAPWA